MAASSRIEISTNTVFQKFDSEYPMRRREFTNDWTLIYTYVNTKKLEKRGML
jgi:hypothetical protein